MGNEIGAAVAVELGTNRYISVHDQRGSVAVLLNPAGTVAESYRYDAYGNVKIYDSSNVESPMSQVGNPWLFSSKRLDKETGLYCFGRRFYDPTLGRFVTADPSGFADGPNLYAYCGGDPVNLIDPDGQLSKSYSSGNSFASSPNWLSSTQNDLHNQQTYGYSFEDSLRGTMAPGIAAASAFNPFNIAQGIADEYQANYNYSGSHYDAANLTFNPVVRGTLNTMQAASGTGYMYNNSGSQLSTGQRIGSGIGAAFNAAEAFGVGYGAARLTTSLAPSLNRVSFPNLASTSEILGPSGPGQFVLRSGQGTLERAGVVRTDRELNRLFDSRWQLGRPYSQPMGGSFSPGSSLPSSASQAIISRGLNYSPSIVNNAELGVVYRANQNIPATFRTSLGGTDPEIMIMEQYRHYLQRIGNFIPTGL